MPPETAGFAAFEAERPRLFAIAYRMLGSASDAEDVLQDAWMRFSGARTDAVRSPQAYAATIVTRLCLDRLKSARAQREQYMGPWLPEPVLTGGGTPDVLAERSESVTLAFLLLLEALSPDERAVFLLKEVFGYEHAEIAAMLGTSPANSRQLLHRAKARLPDVRDTRPAPTHCEIAAQFAEALQAGDIARLTQLLSADVAFVSDGGGKVPAVARPLLGRDRVTTLLDGLHRTAERTGLAARVALDVVEVNAQPAVVLRIGGKLDAVWVLTVEGPAITHIHVVRNPGKLTYLERQLEADR